MRITKSILSYTMLLKQKIFSVSIRSKLLVYFLLFSIIPLVIVGYLSYGKSSQIINRQTKAYSDAMISQITGRFDRMLEDIYKASVQLIVKPVIQENDFKRLSSSEYIMRVKVIESELSLIKEYNSSISSIYLYLNDVGLISPDPFGVVENRNFRNYQVYRAAINSNLSPVWTGVHKNDFKRSSEQNVITMSRVVYGKHNLRSFGVLVMNIDEDTITDICKTGVLTERDNVLILNSQGELLFSKNEVSWDEKQRERYIHSILGGANSKDGFFHKEENSTTYIRYTSSQVTDWTYVIEIPIDYLMKESIDVRNVTVIIMVVCVIASIIASIVLATHFTTPFKNLIASMKNAKKGNFNERLAVMSGDEIGQLTDHYNIMMNEISKLLKKIDEENKLKRQADMKALQAQISPHFLYNTLNSIKCIARVNKDTRILTMTSCLIELLQVSVSNKNVFIDIGEEIEFVKNYLYLQSIRYDNNFLAVYEIDEEVLRYKTLKLIVQPLVENSLLHGIDLTQKGGLIIVRAYCDNNTVVIEVEDNGIGMDAEQIRKLVEGRSLVFKSKFSGIGVNNVIDRIKMYFGERYGVDFKSVPGKGTLAKIMIPCITDEREANIHVQSFDC